MKPQLSLLKIRKQDFYWKHLQWPLQVDYKSTLVHLNHLLLGLTILQLQVQEDPKQIELSTQTSELSSTSAMINCSNTQEPIITDKSKNS